MLFTVPTSAITAILLRWKRVRVCYLQYPPARLTPSSLLETQGKISTYLLAVVIGLGHVIYSVHPSDYRHHPLLETQGKLSNL